MSLTFAHQHLLWFLLIVPILAGLKLVADSHGSRAEKIFIAERLRPVLVVGRSRWLSWLVYLFYLLAMACLIVAVAQPRYGAENLEIPDKGRNVFIAIDTSRSMLAQDVVPDRLTRARLAAHDLVTELDGERVGLLAFAGRAYLQAPLTTDHAAIIESLQAFDHTILEWGGSNLGDLIEVVLRATKNLPKSNYALVIFTDGGEADQNLNAYTQRLTNAGIVIITVGVGAEDGGVLIPDPEIGGDYIRDENNVPVRTRLEAGVLKQLASATNGSYVKLGSQPLTRRTLQPVLDRLTEQQAANRQTSRPIERFAWPLGLGIFFLMLAWILSALPRPNARPALLALTAVFLAHGTDAGAAGLASMQNASAPTPEAAREALEKHDFATAKKLYEELLEQYATLEKQPDYIRSRQDGGVLHRFFSKVNRSLGKDEHLENELLYGLASAEHALTNYDASTRHFSNLLHSDDASVRARAHRGLGHTLYDQGARNVQQQPKITIERWRDSLRHLNAALELEPENAELRANRDHVAKALEQMEQVMKQMEEQQKQQQGKGNKGSKGQKQKGQKDKGGSGENGEGEGESESGEDGSSPQESNKEATPKGEQKGEDDGIGGKDVKELPEGRLQAAGGDQPGQEKDGGKGPKPGEQDGEAQGTKEGGTKPGQTAGTPQDDQRNPKTGYTPGEARGILRQYMDESIRNLSNQQHVPPVNKKDW